MRFKAILDGARGRLEGVAGEKRAKIAGRDKDLGYPGKATPCPVCGGGFVRPGRSETGCPLPRKRSFAVFSPLLYQAFPREVSPD